MNHSKHKTYNRTPSHSRSMFAGMVTDFKRNGHLNTTLAKAKKLHSLLQSELDEKIFLVKLGNRHGDGAPMARLASESYVNAKFKQVNKS